MTETILYSSNGLIGHLVLNNPRRHNALGNEQLEAIKAILALIEADQQIRVLIVTGTGETTFCAGAALQELSDGLMDGDTFQQMTGQLAALRIPTICAINGDVFGGGVELAISCDFRIGVEGSCMQVPAAAIGLCYPLAGIKRFVECLGVNLSKRILVASEEFSAAALLKLGFLDHLVSPQELDHFAQNFAQNIANLAPLAVQSMKNVLRQAAVCEVDDEVARELSKLCLESRDLLEGFAAKREKRSPNFEGR